MTGANVWVPILTMRMDETRSGQERQHGHLWLTVPPSGVRRRRAQMGVEQRCQQTKVEKTRGDRQEPDGGDDPPGPTEQRANNDEQRPAPRAPSSTYCPVMASISGETP